MLIKLIGVFLGMIVCQAVFGIFALTTMQLWPNYAIHVDLYLNQRIFTFTATMACLNLVFWVLAFFGAGWTTSRMTRDGKAIWALAVLMDIYAAYVHVWRDWSIFPWWYNLVVVLSVIPATLLGALATRAADEAPKARRGLLKR
jgi:hypothetical protein